MIAGAGRRAAPGRAAVGSAGPDRACRALRPMRPSRASRAARRRRRWHRDPSPASWPGAPPAAPGAPPALEPPAPAPAIPVMPATPGAPPGRRRQSDLPDEQRRRDAHDAQRQRADQSSGAHVELRSAHQFSFISHKGRTGASGARAIARSRSRYVCAHGRHVGASPGESPTTPPGFPDASEWRSGRRRRRRREAGSAPQLAPRRYAARGGHVRRRQGRRHLPALPPERADRRPRRVRRRTDAGDVALLRQRRADDRGAAVLLRAAQRLGAAERLSPRPGHGAALVRSRGPADPRQRRASSAAPAVGAVPTHATTRHRRAGWSASTRGAVGAGVVR